MAAITAAAAAATTAITDAAATAATATGDDIQQGVYFLVEIWCLPRGAGCHSDAHGGANLIWLLPSEQVLIRFDSCCRLLQGRLLYEVDMFINPAVYHFLGRCAILRMPVRHKGVSDTAAEVDVPSKYQHGGAC